jgi:5-methylcytosine-specific restriction endonuclease McrA
MTPYGHHWRTVTRPLALIRAGYECQRCGIGDRSMGNRSALDVAHLLIPPGQPGHDDEDNLAVLCPKDHRAHDYTQWAEKFRAWLLVEKDRRITAADAARPILAMLTEVA